MHHPYLYTKPFTRTILRERCRHKKYSALRWLFPPVCSGPKVNAPGSDSKPPKKTHPTTTRAVTCSAELHRFIILFTAVQQQMVCLHHTSSASPCPAESLPWWKILHCCCERCSIFVQSISENTGFSSVFRRESKRSHEAISYSLFFPKRWNNFTGTVPIPLPRNL